mgnify:CR=1 FL=1
MMTSLCYRDLSYNKTHDGPDILRHFGTWHRITGGIPKALKKIFSTLFLYGYFNMGLFSFFTNLKYDYKQKFVGNKVKLHQFPCFKIALMGK